MIPDVFIVGAPKCGTTSLVTWLGQHPQIFISPIKEPNYFCFDAPMRRSISTPQAYSALFARAQPSQICGEASTSYLFSSAAVPGILEANSQAKIIAMVRSPLDMLVSYHAQKIYSLQEEETDFEQAWRLSPERAKGKAIAMRGHAPRYLDYRAIGQLGEQVRRLKGYVPERQLHIIVFDDLQADRAAVYRDALLFLGLEPEDRDDLPVMNSRKARVWPGLADFMQRPPPPMGWVKQAAQTAFPEQTRTLGKRLKALNTQPLERKRVNRALRREMIENFRDDVELLGRLLDRDLSDWLKHT